MTFRRPARCPRVPRVPPEQVGDWLRGALAHVTAEAPKAMEVRNDGARRGPGGGGGYWGSKDEHMNILGVTMEAPKATEVRGAEPGDRR